MLGCQVDGLYCNSLGFSSHPESGKMDHTGWDVQLQSLLTRHLPGNGLIGHCTCSLCLVVESPRLLTQIWAMKSPVQPDPCLQPTDRVVSSLLNLSTVIHGSLETSPTSCVF